MTTIANSGLSVLRRTVMMRAGVGAAALLLLCLFAETAAAQQQEKRRDLDVTMQIIVDPDAKLPDEVVRRIPLPARKSADPSAAAAGGPSDKSGKPETGPDKDRDSEANEHGKETSEAAQERAREAADQREAARRAKAEERREHGPPDHPDPPGRPPRD